MNEHLTSFLDLARPFGEVVAAVPESAWDSPSPCEGWTAAGVLDHVVDSQRDFLALHDLSPGERPVGAPVDVWAQHLAGVRERLGDGAVLSKEYDGYFGRTTLGATLRDFYAFDLVPHRWDLARSAGLDTVFTDAELDLVESRIKGLGDALYGEGVCAAPVPVPADASRQDRVLGLLGRDPAGDPAG